MLARLYRLRKQKEIELVFKKGKTYKYQEIILKSINNNLSHHRFVLIVSKKVSPSAVVRNKIKRRLQEIIRQKIKLSNSKKHKDNVLIILPGIQEKDFQQLKKMIEFLFKMANL